MANHKLSLDAPDTLNPCVLRLVDTSSYDANMAIKCPTLQITPPGYSEAFVLDVQSEFNKNYSACDIGLQTQSCGTVFNNLPDGVWVLRYSVSPNDLVYVEYNHLRITVALIRIRDIFCDLDVSGCQPDDKTLKKLRQIGDIQLLFQAAKAKVENCREPRKGMDIYNYAWSQLNKIECRTCKK